MIHLKINCSVFLSMHLLFFTSSVAAQEPGGYYDAAHGLSGEALKSALYEIIKGHTEFPYTSVSTDTWDILKETDRDTANSENVILFYSGWCVNAAQEYNNAGGWTRELVWAKSHGDFGTGKGAGTDVHHIRPVDLSINSARGNKDFDWGGNLYVDGDGSTECYSNTYSWEPRNAVKGDVARMLFYMAVRYEGENGDPDLELLDEVNTVTYTETGKGFHGKLSALLEWHTADPVDSFELRRNEVIYSYQGNRNPFIDHPEFAGMIWTVTGNNAIKVKPFKIYPNPANDFICIEGSSERPAEIKILSMQGKPLLVRNFSGNIKISVGDYPQGIYVVKIIEENKVYTDKVIYDK